MGDRSSELAIDRADVEIEDPRAVAERFGSQHSLSDNYINQIEEFIRSALGGTSG